MTAFARSLAVRRSLYVLAFAAGAALSSCSQCGCTGPVGPVGPVGPTAAPTSLPTVAPDLLAFSTIVVQQNQPTGQVTVVDVSTPTAPVIVARLLGPSCPAGFPGQVSGQAGIDPLGDVVTGVACFSETGSSGSLVVYPRTGATYGSPVTLAQSAVTGIAVNGNTLDYLSLSPSGAPSATLSIDSWTPPSTMTPLASLQFDDSAEAFDDMFMAIAPSGLYLALTPQSDMPAPLTYGVVAVSPNAAGPVATQFSTAHTTGVAVDPSGNIWSLDTSGSANANLVVRSASGGAVTNTEAVVPRGLLYTIGMQFDRSGNLWIASQNTAAATVNGAGSTTIYGYLSPSATAAQLPAPVTSFGLANSVEYIQAKKRP